MKIKLIVFLFIILNVYSNGYSQIKTIGDRYIGCNPDTFRFYTIGNTHSGQIWSSGNGNNSSIDTPVFLFNLPGTYKVKIGNLEKDITILPKLNYNFTTDSTKFGCFPFKFNLRDITNYPVGIYSTKVDWVYQNGGSSIGASSHDVITNYFLYNCFVKMIVKTNVPSCTGQIQKDSFFQILDIPVAKIKLTPDSSCRVPFSPIVTNKSKDSLKTNLTYLWKWNLPSASSSTSFNPPLLTYTTNSAVVFTLEAINKFGCKGYDTVKYKIDTPTVSFKLTQKVCAKGYGYIDIDNYDTANYTYKVVSQTRANGQDIFRLTKPFGGPVIPPDAPYSKVSRFAGFDGDYPNQNVKRSYTLIKTSKRDTSCKVRLTKELLLCQTFPQFKVNVGRSCGFPFRDSIIVTNTIGNEDCWDSLSFSVIYFDKYLIGITKDSFNAVKAQKFTQSIKDSIFLYGLDSLKKVDSFYRKGPFGLSVNVNFFSQTDTFNCEHDASGGALHYSVFRPHLVDYFNKGCVSKKDSFVVYNYGNGKIASIEWHFGDDSVKTTSDSTVSHFYLSKGNYKAFAVVTNSNGCIDTTNPVYVKRGDSIVPQMSISNKTICITDSTTISIQNSTNFDKWKFLTDNTKVLDCPNSLSATYNHFYNAGKQYVYILAEKDGCKTKIKDSIYVDGPRFMLNYDFKCSRKDNFKFFLTDTVGIRASSYQWDFGDGTLLNSGLDTQWHIYTGSNDDHWVKVTILNPSGCKYIDSIWVHARKVKAIFTDTLFCKQTFFGAFLNSTPYVLNPLKSQNADYICDYQYTWLMESITNPSIKFPPATGGNTLAVNLPLDTMNLSLIARDINGCSDTMKRTVYLGNNHIDFKLIYDSCPPVQIIQCVNLSTSPWGIFEYDWRINKIKNGLDTFRLDSSFLKNPNFRVDTFMSDSFKITLKITDSAKCAIKYLSKLFIFVKDSSKLKAPDTICHYSTPSIYSTENDLINYKYRWFINGHIQPDTVHKLNNKFDTLGRQIILLEKTHRFKGCKNKFIDTIWVNPKPNIRLDNSFDLATNKCFPSITTIDYFDSLSIPNVYFKFIHNGSHRTVKPTTIALDAGINLISAVFTTSYGCYDSFVNYDTVYSPSADLELSKKMICKNDSIEFKLINLKDVDSILWSFGDGVIYSGVKSRIYHRYTTANILSDSIPVSFIVFAPNKACPASKSDTILVYEAIAGHYLNNKIDTAYCLSSVMIHNAAPRADSIRWDFGNGINLENQLDSFSYKHAQAGIYDIKQYAYRKPLGCIDSSLKRLILFPIPKLTAQVDSVCLGSKLDIFYQSNLPNTKAYLLPDSFQNSPYSQSPISTQISKSTKFNLIGESSNSCRDTIQVNAHVIMPHNEINFDTILVTGAKLSLPVNYNPYWTYTWTPNLVNPSCINCPNPELQILDTALYQLSIHDYRNCFKFDYNYRIRLYPDIVVRVPKAFSPNGDGFNDFVYARGFGIKKLLSFKIFNRHGQLLFMTDNEMVGWDGYYKNVLQNTDAYFYTYEAESFIPGKIVTGEGNFMLLK